MPYWGTVTLVAFADNAIYKEYVYSVNSVNQPDITGTGHRPRGYDQWSALYTRYLVRGFSYQLTLRPSDNNAAGDNSSFGIWGVHPCGIADDAFFNSIDDFMERNKDQGDKYKYWLKTSSTGMASTSTAWDARNNSNFIKGYVSCKNISKQYSPEAVWPNGHWAPFGSNPATVAAQTMIVWIASLPQGTGTSGAPELNRIGTTFLEAKFTYYVELGDPVEVAQST